MDETEDEFETESWMKGELILFGAVLGLWVLFVIGMFYLLWRAGV